MTKEKNCRTCGKRGATVQNGSPREWYCNELCKAIHAEWRGNRRACVEKCLPHLSGRRRAVTFDAYVHLRVHRIVS